LQRAEIVDGWMSCGGLTLVVSIVNCGWTVCCRFRRWSGPWPWRRLWRCGGIAVAE